MADYSDLTDTISELMTTFKIMYSSDECIDTIRSQFERANIDNPLEEMNFFRHILYSTPGLQDHICGISMHFSYLNAWVGGNMYFPSSFTAMGILPGIKMNYPPHNLLGPYNELISNGITTMVFEANIYRSYGIKYVIWPIVVTLGENPTTVAEIASYAKDVAFFAYFCQQFSLIHMDMTHQENVDAN